jgi:6-pyruvoyltetrahydropterin/6-carboxytetrahydropterin synthase
MYEISCEIEVAGAHKLNLSYQSKCEEIHGHNWVVKVFCRSLGLNEDGMIIDYVDIKKIVNELDHGFINDKVDFNPTAENLCRYLCDKIPFCYKVEIKEASKSWASYTR